jgi:hypothetical protein
MADQDNFDASVNSTEEALDMNSLVNTDDVQVPSFDNELNIPEATSSVDMRNPIYPEIEGPGTGIVNFDDTYPGGYDVELFEDVVDQAIEIQGMPNLEMNQPFFDMIDRAAVDLNKYPIMFSNNDMNAAYPGRAGTDWDPFRTSTGIPDLSSSNGIKAFLSTAIDKTHEIKGPNQTPGYKDPFHYSARDYNMDRYYRHPRFTDLGFNPMADNEAYYQQNSSKWDNFARTRSAFVDMYGPAFTSGWRSIGQMFTGQTLESDMVGATAMDDAMRIGASGSGGTRGFFNDLFLNSAYTMGIISSIAVEEAVLFGAAALQGGMNPASDALLVTRTGINIGKGFNALRRLFKASEWGAAGTKFLAKMKSMNNVRAYWNAAKTGGRATGRALGHMFGPETLYQFKKIQAAAKAGDNFTQMAKGAAYAGGLYRDFRAINLAWSESKMEAGLVEMKLQNELYEDVMKLKDGADPSIDEMKMIVGDARAAGLTTSLINFPIIFLSNKLVLDGALRGFKPLGRVMDESLSGPLGRILMRKGLKENPFVDMGKKWIVGENMRRMWKAGFKASWKHMGATALRYSTANFAEGVQELAQEATSHGVKSYFTSLYDSPMGVANDVHLAQMTQAHKSGTESMYGNYTHTDRISGMTAAEAIKQGAGSQWSGQGLHTFMSGFLMGGIVQGPQRLLFDVAPNVLRWGKDKVMKTTDYADFRAERDQQISNAVETLNKVYNDPSQYFDIKKLNAMTQKELNSAMFEAAGADDITSFMDAKDHATFSALYTVMSTGNLNHFTDQLNDFKKLDDVALKEAFSSVASTPEKIRGRIDKMLDRAKDIKKGYNKMKDEFVNPFNPKKYKKDSRKYHEEQLRQIAFEHSKMMAMFTKATFEQSLERANDIYNTLSSDPVLGSISASDIRALTSREGLVKEMALLEKEVKLGAKTAEEKELLARKKKKLELLKNYSEIFNDKENQATTNGQMYYDIFEVDGQQMRTKSRNIGRYDKRKMGKLKPAFVAYLQFLAETNDDLVIDEKIIPTLKKIIDFGYLKGRAADFHQAANILMNPENLYEMTDRLAAIMGEAWEQHRDKNNLTVKLKKYHDQIIRKQFLKDLADEGIQPDPDQVISFLEDGRVPTDYFDDEGKITKSSDPLKWATVEGLKENYYEATKVDKSETTDATPEERRAAEEEGTEGNQAEPDFESVTGRSKYQQFLQKDKDTRDIINRKYNEYKASWNSEKGPLMGKNEWAASVQGGKNIIKSRYELDQMYQAESAEVKDKYPTLEDWLVANKKNPLIVGTNGILTKNNVSISDVSVKMSEDTGVQRDKLDGNQRIIATDKTTGLSVIEVTNYDENDNKDVQYYISDRDPQNRVWKTYENLNPKGKKTVRSGYVKKTDAVKAYNYILRNMPSDTVFEFGKDEQGMPIKWTTSDVVIDSAGNEYIVRSNPKMVRRNNNLYVVPIDKAKAKKGEDERVYITEDEWRTQGWKKKGETTLDISTTQTKLTSYEPVKIYPFDGSKVKFGEFKGFPVPEEGADLAFEDVLRSLTEEDRQNITFLVEKNPAHEQYLQDLESGKLQPYQGDPRFDPNPAIRSGENKYEVTIMLGNRPIGKMMGIGIATLVDPQTGKKIDGHKITAEQTERIFRLNGKDASEVAAMVRRNYAKAALITKEFESRIGSKSSVKIKSSSLKNIELNINNGWTGWYVDSKGNPINPKSPAAKKNARRASTPWSDIPQAYNNYDGELIIYDTKRSRDTGRRASTKVWSVDPGSARGKTISNEITNYIHRRGLMNVGQLQSGRYLQFVKLPNGTIHHFELKLDPLSEESLNDIAVDIKNKQQELLDKAYDDKGKLDKKQAILTRDKINQELSESFYILSNVVGDDIEIFFNETGEMVFKVERGGSKVTIGLEPKFFEAIVDGKSLIETINHEFKRVEAAKAKKDKKFKKTDFVLTLKSFTSSIPANLSDPTQLVDVGVSARVVANISFAQLADVNYTNEVDIKEVINSPGTAGGTMTQTTPYDTEAGPEVQLPNTEEENSYEIPESKFTIPEVTSNSDRLTLIEETLSEKNKSILALMREKNHAPEKIEKFIFDKAKETANGNKLLADFEMEDILNNPQEYSEALVVNAMRRRIDGSSPISTGSAEVRTAENLKEIKEEILEGEPFNQTWTNEKAWHKTPTSAGYVEFQGKYSTGQKGMQRLAYESLVDLGILEGVDNTTVTELTDELWAELMEQEFKNLPEGILMPIRRKIANSISLTARERLILDALESQGKNILDGITSEETATKKNEDGLQAESGNQNIINQIENKKQEILSAEDRIERELTAQIKKANPIMSNAELEIEVDKMMDQSDELKKLNTELTKLQSKLGYKILPEFDGNDVENIDAFVEWVKKNLPDSIMIGDIDDLAKRLKANGVTVGAFVMELSKVSGGIKDLVGKVYTGKQSPFRYHEAFHGIFRMLLTDAEIKKYLGIAKNDVRKQMQSSKGYEILPGVFVKNMNQARIIMRGLAKSYALMDDAILNERIYEEYLADEFEKFKTNPRSSKVGSEVKDWFTRLLEWIKNIFLRYNSSELNDLFTSIDSGKYKEAGIQNNRFTREAMEEVTESGAVTSVALKAIRKGDAIASTRPVVRNGVVIPDGRTIYINNYFTAKETNGIVAEIGAMYLDRLDNLTDDPNFTGEYNPSAILDQTIDEYTERYAFDRSVTDSDGNEIYHYAGKINRQTRKKLKERYESLKQYKSDVKDSVTEYLELFDEDVTSELEVLEKVDMSTDGQVKTTEEYEKNANEIGGWKSLSKGIRKFLATTTKEVKDEFTGEIVSVPVDYITSYNALMKSLSGMTNMHSMLVKLKLFSESSEDARAVIDAILTKTNLSNYTLEDFINGKYNLNQVTNQNFFNGIIKAFSQFRTDYYYLETDTDKGLVNIFKANHRDDAHTQTDRWQGNYTSKLERLNTDSNALNSALSPWGSIIFNTNKESIKEEELDSTSKRIQREIENSIGFDLSWMTIKYLILSNGITNKTDIQANFLNTFKSSEIEFNLDDVAQIETAISNHGLTKDGRQTGNLFYDMNEVSVEQEENEVNAEGTDVKSRIKKLAKLNSAFDDTVGATVFRNPEGKLIYAHQMPTYDLEKIAELNSEDAIDELMNTNKFMDSNYLLNSPKFRKLAADGKLRISRVAGQKIVDLNTDSEGNFKSSNGIDLSKRAISFGDSTPKDFLSQMINLYLADYNNLNGKVTENTYEYEDEYGNTIEGAFTTSLTNVTVIAESNTADFVPLPTIAAVQLKDGKSTMTDEYVEDVIGEIETEYYRIQREVQQTEGYTEDNVKGYNEFTSVEDINDEDNKTDRAAKFGNTAELLKSKERTSQTIREVGDGIQFALGPAEVKSTQSGTSIVLREVGHNNKKLGLNQDESVRTPIYTLKSKKATEETYSVTYKGVVPIESYNVDTIKEMLNNDWSESKTGTHTHEVKLGSESIWVRSARQRDWINGKKDLEVFEVVRSSEIETEITELGEEIITTKDKVLKELQRIARTEVNDKGNPILFSDALDMVKQNTGIDVKELVIQRLNQEFEEFLEVIGPGQTGAINQLDKRLTSKLTTAEGKTNKNTERSMVLLNLENNNTDNHNLKQIFFNDYLNRISIKQILLGDRALGLKDAVDEIKRMKALNAAGASAESIIAAPELGVIHPTKHISLITMTDVETPSKYNTKGKEGKVTETDAQMWITTKAFRHMMFGFGSLNSAQALILDRIEAGEDISIDEFYGVGISKNGFKELGAILNSKKLVYFDGKAFLKMSAFVLTKALSSDPQSNFQTALPGREDMHNLRLKLEKIEQDGNETIAMAVPESASKMVKRNIIDHTRAFDANLELNPEDITDLDARWMRLQQVNPSNKGIIIDPTQIKQIITSEHDDSVKVTFAGEKTTIGKIREIYNNAVSSRVEIKYLDRRNLIFDFQKGQDELQASIKKGQVTPDLQAFLEYAKDSLTSSGARAQFMELFEVDEAGQPKYDLNNPITINKFQELFMSFFTKGVMSEKVNGESIALVSGQGMKVIKKVKQLDPVTGQPIEWEVIRMQDYANLKNRPEIKYNNYTDAASKTFADMKVGDIYVDELRANVTEYDEKGNETGLVYSEMMLPAYHESLKNIKPGERIPDVIAKAFATRIPSQDKHSAINLRLVDFMPVYYGSSGVFPSDLIEISGADFDIDKLYVQLKEFYRQDGEFVEYGKTEDTDKQYEEYLRYKQAESKQKGTSMHMAVQKWNNRGRIIDIDLDADVSLPSEEIIGGLRLLDLPVTREEFAEYLKKNNNRLPYSGAHSNTALDAKYALLGHEGMTKGRNGRDVGIAYEPAVIDPLEDVWSFIQQELPELAKEVQEEGVMIDNMLGMYRAWKNNKEGANSIGAIVLPNIVLNLLKEYEVDLRSKTSNGVSILGGNLELNGIQYKSFKGDYAIDPETGKPDTRGLRKQFVISALVTAATDNAKERLLAKLGLNKDALATVGTLLSVGVDITTAILLVNQPDIKRMYALAANKEKPTDPGMDSILKREKAVILAEDAFAAKNSKKVNVDTELLMRHIKGEELATYERFAILTQFQEARALKENVGHLQALVTKVAGLGRGMKEMYDSFESFEKLGSELNNVQFGKQEIPFDSRELFKGKTFQATYYKIFQNIQQLTPVVFLTETDEFRKITSAIIANMKDQSPERVQKVKQDVLSYMIGKGYTMYLGKIGKATLGASLQNGMIYDEYADGLTIADVINDIKAQLKGKPNYFIDQFVYTKDTKNPNNKSGINQAVSNTWGKIGADQMTLIQNSLRELYADENIRHNVYHLLHYELVKNGLQYSDGTLLGAFPASMLDELLLVSENIKDTFNNERVTDQMYNTLFGMSFDELISEVTEGYLQSRSNVYYIPEIKLQRGQAIQYSSVKESDTVEDFQGYKGGFENKGKGTPQGDGKDKAMRKVANTSITEISNRTKESSSKTTEDQLPWDSNKSIDGIVMLARNGSLRGQNLTAETKERIDEAFERNATFVVGDMPGVDSQFIDYLQEIGADFTIYHTGKTPRISLSSQENINQEKGILDISKYSRRKSRSKKKGTHKRKGTGKVFDGVLKKAGFKEVGNEFEFPLVITMNVGARRKPDYRTFKLEEVYSTNKIEKTELSDPNYTPQMINVDTNFGKATGYRAVYKEFDTFGSMQQNGMGFMWGDRSTYQYLQDEINKTTSAIEDGNQQQDDMFSKLTKQEQKSPIGPGTNVNINATNDSIETSDNDNKDVSLSKIQKLSEKGEPDFDAIIKRAAPEKGLKKDAMSENATQPGENKVLEDFYENLTKLDKAMLFKAADISNIEELIEDFNDPNNQYNEEDFIENLKKCYSK